MVTNRQSEKSTFFESPILQLTKLGLGLGFCLCSSFLTNMVSEEISLVLSHHSQNHNSHSHSHLLFQDDSNLPFRCTPPQHNHHIAGHTINNNNGKTTRELTGFIEHQNRHCQPQSTTEFHRSMPPYFSRDSSSPSGDRSDSDDDEEDDDMDDGHVNARKSNIGEKNGNGKRNHISCIGSIREVMKEGSVIMNDVRSSPIENNQQGQLCQYQNAITIADPNSDLYYSQYLNGVEGSGTGFKDMLVDNGCGFSGRKDVSGSGRSGESLRAILSDPLTGALMDDAMILPCGHSFSISGMQLVMRMKACYTCSHPVSEGSVAPNLSLQSAVHAFRREEELQTHRASKRRNRFEQDKSNYGALALVDQSRGRGVQFPFAVTERVIIKGNKRTPPRFVGREAIVTTQCLNGWYVVKTLDNAESVKLQYRSLAKIQDSQPANLAVSKMTTPNWL